MLRKILQELDLLPLMPPPVRLGKSRSPCPRDGRAQPSMRRGAPEKATAQRLRPAPSSIRQLTRCLYLPGYLFAAEVDCRHAVAREGSKEGQPVKTCELRRQPCRYPRQFVKLGRQQKPRLSSKLGLGHLQRLRQTLRHRYTRRASTITCLCSFHQHPVKTVPGCLNIDRLTAFISDHRTGIRKAGLYILRFANKLILPSRTNRICQRHFFNRFNDQLVKFGPPLLQ